MILVVPNDIMEAIVGIFQIRIIVQHQKLIKHCCLKTTVTDSPLLCA